MIQLSNLWSSIQDVFDPATRQSTRQLVILLPGAGCEWAKKSGGCYMCGFSKATRAYSKGLLLPAAFSRVMIRRSLLRHSDAETVAIYNGGSFLNPHEIPKSLPVWLCRQVGKSERVRQLFVESRPEFVDTEPIRKMVGSLGSKTLKVGLGLECVTDFIRDHCVHKGFSLFEYEKAIGILKSQGARVLTYVFLKPLFLSEAEAIEEAVKTIAYAFDQGSDEVALESAFVQEGTLLHQMYRQVRFRPPWLWSIIEVAKRTSALGFVHIGGFTDEPAPIAVPTNCPRCSQSVQEALEHFRRTHDFKALEGLRCDCQSEWRSELQKVYPPLSERTITTRACNL